MSPPVIELKGIEKQFPGVRALDGVDLQIRAGEVLALMGENGAGKSTLLRILRGEHRPTGGELLLDGEPLELRTPRDAHDLGIRVINQEPEIVPGVSVAENVFLGDLPRRKGRTYRAGTLRRQVDERIRDLGFDGVLRADTRGDRLAPAQRQLVEILRAVKPGSRVLCFDEPTSSLTDDETDRLFELIERFRDEGTAIVYVSHRMSEIFRIADRIAVLRDGGHVGTREANATDEDEIVRMMVGRDLDDVFADDADRAVAEPVLEVRALTNDHVHDIDLTVRAGEIVAIAGLVGAGRSELAKTIFGELPATSGQILVRGEERRMAHPRHAIRAGIGFAPEERKAEALFLDRGVKDNIAITLMDRLRRFRFVDGRRERQLAEEYVGRLRVRTPSLAQHVRKLSGGNQQKIVLARWLARRPDVLILDEPTRGVDVGAKSEIYRIIHQLAADGVGVLFVSSELPEVLGLADRAYVMAGGRITGELTREDASEEAILRLAMMEGVTDAGAGANR